MAKLINQVISGKSRIARRGIMTGRLMSHRLSKGRFASSCALTLILALLLAPFAAINPAQAACNPAVVADGGTVNCTGLTDNQQGAGTGYGTANNDNVTYNIGSNGGPAASVIGTSIGIESGVGGTFNNFGTIQGDDIGINAGDIHVNNAGTISAVNNLAIQSNGTVTISNNGVNSLISGDAGISGSTVIVTGNAGTIEATGNNQSAIFGNIVNIISNNNLIQATGTGIGAGIDSGTVNITGNAGTISGTAFGISTNGGGDAVNISSNSGTISGGRIGIVTQNLDITNHSGTISGGQRGIFATNVDITNSSGTISGGSIAGIDASTVNIGNNTGSILGILNGSSGINAGTVTINANTGTISGGSNGTGILSSGIAVNIGSNSGTISGGSSAISAETVTVAGNTGTISGGIVGIVMGSGTITNNSTGIISGTIAIQAADPSQGSVIINSGTIRSTDGALGTAIKLTAAADTLTLRAGSIVGKIDMGDVGGVLQNDVINVEGGGSAVARGLSSLSVSVNAAVAALQAQLVNFGGVINAIISSSPGGQPTVTANGVTAALDPTALAQQDRVLMDFTGGVSSMVRDRLNASSTGSNVRMMSYAMDNAHGAENANTSAVNAANAQAKMFTKAPAAGWDAAPLTVWTSGFGGVRNQNETELTLSTDSTVFGGAIGVDRRVRPNWLLGVFAGGGSSTLSGDLNSQTVDTDYGFGGGYSRFEWANQFFDATVQVGTARNRSDRLVQNNITSSLEHATASNSGWFISPEVAYGYRMNIGNGYVLTPMARVRYVAGVFDDYSETGSAQTLSVGSRTLQNFEERGELEVSKTTDFFGGAHILKTNVHGGVIALQRVGDATINAVLIGQSLSFVTPGENNAVGAVLGAGFDYHTSQNVAVFGALEGTAMSDHSVVGTARGGLRLVW